MENLENSINEEIYPILLTGTIDGMEFVIPFSTGGDATRYIEMLAFTMSRQKSIMDIKMMKGDELIGEIKSPNFKTLEQ